jgi:hypothetical protein
MPETPVAKKKVKTTFAWEHSSSYYTDLNSGDVCVECAVCVKTAINGKEQAEQVLPPESTQISVEAFEGDHVIVFVSYRNRKCVFSKARGYDIHVSSEITPDPVGEIRIAGVAVSVSLSTVI